MRQIPSPREITTPQELRELLAEIKLAIASGFLKENTVGYEGVTYREIEALGTWPDYLEVSFIDTRTNDAYQLSVDIYHGAGGIWRML